MQTGEKQLIVINNLELNWIKQRWNILLIQGYQFKTFFRVKLSRREDTDIEIYFVSVQKLKNRFAE